MASLCSFNSGTWDFFITWALSRVVLLCFSSLWVCDDATQMHAPYLVNCWSFSSTLMTADSLFGAAFCSQSFRHAVNAEALAFHLLCICGDYLVIPFSFTSFATCTLNSVMWDASQWSVLLTKPQMRMNWGTVKARPRRSLSSERVLIECIIPMQ